MPVIQRVRWRMAPSARSREVLRVATAFPFRLPSLRNRCGKPEPVQAQSVLVVFGEALGLENAIRVRFGEFSRAAREKPVPTPLEGRKLPRIWRAGMSLVSYRRTRRRRCRQRCLPAASQREQEPAPCRIRRSGGCVRQRIGVDEVFGIVRHHDSKRSQMLFKQQQALEDPVEAVGFGGGAVVRATARWTPGKCFRARGRPRGSRRRWDRRR